MCCKLVLSALLASGNVVINEVMYMRLVVLVCDEFQGIDDSVVPGHKGVIISDDNS